MVWSRIVPISFLDPAWTRPGKKTQNTPEGLHILPYLICCGIASGRPRIYLEDVAGEKDIWVFYCGLGSTAGRPLITRLAV